MKVVSYNRVATKEQLEERGKEAKHHAKGGKIGHSHSAYRHTPNRRERRSKNKA